MNVGRSNRLTRFEKSALPEPGGAFSWVEREPWFTPDSHPGVPDRTVSCTEVVAVLVTPLPGSQEIGSAGTAGAVSSHVANVNVGRSNRLTRFEKEPPVTNL